MLTRMFTENPSVVEAAWYILTAVNAGASENQRRAPIKTLESV